MGRGEEKRGLPQAKWGSQLENLAIVILAFYPLRHIGWGLDLWDTGYNYANFQYMGTRHMDPMWFFSTYLTSVVGNLLTKLPQADTLRGMNLYTGLFASLLALTGYFFCTRKLKMPKPVVFLGEMAALSLCWCPTASLYNYLTYVLFLFSVIFLYLGLVRDKKGYLVCAGVLLGSNVLVRFSNLPEAAMIVAVWAYDIILWLEDRKRGNRAEKVWLEGRKGGNRAEKVRPEGRKGGNEAEKVWPEERKGGTGWTSAEKTLPGNSSSGQAEQDELRKAVIESGGERGAERGAAGEGFWHRTIRHTLWCLVGYAAALAFLLSYIHICYGIQEYAAGIQRLFAMTDRAADYKPSAMIMGIVGAYVENLYWVVRIGGILAGGMVLFAAAGWLEALLLRFQGQKGDKTPSAAARAIPVAARLFWAIICAAALWLLCRKGFFSFLFPDRIFARYPGLVFLVLAALSGALTVNVRMLHMGVRVLWAAVCGSMVWWLYQGGFFSFLFYSYDPIWHPGPLFLMLTMLIAAVRIFRRDSPREEKLISGMIILIILLTPIGSNNGVLPSLNNLFLAAPYTLWESWRFLRCAGEKRLKRGLVLWAFPAKSILVSFLVLCLFQFGAFGAIFAFAEATGIQDAEATVDNNAVLRNIKMSPQKAEWMTQLSAYANENGLQGQEVILYGWIPALSYYLQMPSAFNPWSDLDSYSCEAMEEDMEELEARIQAGAEKPVIILENIYALYVEAEGAGSSGIQEPAGSGVAEGSGAAGNADSKSAENAESGNGEGADPEAAEGSGLVTIGVEDRQRLDADPKWKLLLEYMEAFGYEQTFRNEKFAVYR